MAETAKILNPAKNVFIPDKDAGCSLASSITAADVKKLKQEYPGVPVIAYINTYAATKAFVILFSRGLRWELKSSGISVSCLSPGATSTGFIDRAGMQSLKERAEKFSMKPEVVAEIAVKQMFKGKAEIIPGFVNWLSANLTYFVPKYVVEKIAAGLYK